MAFKDNNVAHGLPKNAPFQVGISDVDNNDNIEQGINIPWSTDSAGSYVYYDCTVGAMLDSGIVVHNRLPQINNTPDTLASVFLDDPNLANFTNRGVSLSSHDQYLDIVQRMGHSRYWFRIWGQALRIGFQVPIPAIKFIGGVAAVPYDKNPQWAFNKIFPNGNFGGVILWHAQWSLWYTTIVPPVTNTIPAANPLVSVGTPLPPPNGIQSPFSEADANSQAQGAPIGFIASKKY